MIASAQAIVERIESSNTFKEYDTAFRNATGLPLEITEVNRVAFALCSKTHGDNEFCRLMSSAGYHCDTCRLLNTKIQETLERGCTDCFSEESREGIGLTEKTPQLVSSLHHDFWDEGPKTFECFAGLCESLVPIRVEGKIIGFLKTGQVLLQKPTKNAFRDAVKKIREIGSITNQTELEESYFKTKVIPPQQYEAMVMLLKMFSDQLSTLVHHLMIGIDHEDPVMIQKTKTVIRKQFSEPLYLNEIACSVSVSPSHLSRTFKENTGMGVLEFLNRVRVDRAKELLIQKDIGIAEIAFKIGFQSLAPFNKAFKRFVGKTPKEYRFSKG